MCISACCWLLEIRGTAPHLLVENGRAGTGLKDSLLLLPFGSLCKADVPILQK